MGYAFTLNTGQDDEMKVQGYSRCLWSTIITWIAIVFTAGLLRLVFYWKPYWFLRCTHKKTSVCDATDLHLQDLYDQDFVVTVKDSRDSKHMKAQLFQNGNRNVAFQMSYGSFSSMKANDTVSIDYNQLSETTEASGKYFHCKKVKYIYSEKNLCFERLCGLETEKKTSYFHETPELTDRLVAHRAALYGLNKLEVHVTPIAKVIAVQVISPFYVFQLGSCILWYIDSYPIYASVIVGMSLISIVITTVTTRQMERALKKTVHQSRSATVRRNGKTMTILSTELVPGDIIEIPRTGLIMDVDAVLLTGNCIVNESMLTGESIPVTKTPLPNPKDSEVFYNTENHSKHTLFCGTKVIQCRYYGEHAVTAMVIKTGFMTAKGGLIRSIMFPKPVDFRFYRETYYFLIAMGLFAAIGVIYVAVVMVRHERTNSEIAILTLELITTAVPAILPAALSVGIVIAQDRLKRRYRIYCIQPSYINIAGSINVVCFDKTGTLTEDGLDMRGVVPKNSFDTAEIVSDISGIPNESLIKICMASCHSLTHIDGILSGDPLDLTMLKATGWLMEEPGDDQNRYDMIMPTVLKPENSVHNLEIGILKQFTFSSSLQRMSVIARNVSRKQFELFSKGSPEMIASLCDQKTLPEKFSAVLANYTDKGYRVIALAHRILEDSYTKLERTERSELEKDLNFLGLVILENKLKPETSPAIMELHNAHIRTVMVTGDNMLTAASIAKECGIIRRNQRVILVSQTVVDGHSTVGFYSPDDGKSLCSEEEHKVEVSDVNIEVGDFSNYCFALTGKTWEKIYSQHRDIIGPLLVKGCIWARMSPKQKGQLVEELQRLGYYVAMCGDGANDCGALKAAHSGISLSEAEASVASPFTSQIANIQCVPELMKAGRCALVTSFGIFKFICGYCLCETVGVILLRSVNSNFTQYQYLVLDLFIITSISLTFPLTNPADTLHKIPPPVKLADILPIFALLFNLGITALVQFGAYSIPTAHWVDFNRTDTNTSWFTECNDETWQCSHVSFVFCVAIFQVLAPAVMYSKGYPYRKNMFTNYWFTANFTIMFAMAVWFVIYPTEDVANWLELDTDIPIEFRAILLGIGLAHFFFSILYETTITGNHFIHAAVERAKLWCGVKDTEYNNIRRQLLSSPDWPPVQRCKDGFSEILAKELNIPFYSAPIMQAFQQTETV